VLSLEECWFRPTVLSLEESRFWPTVLPLEESRFRPTALPLEENCSSHTKDETVNCCNPATYGKSPAPNDAGDSP
jgi:hypothetical protein